MATPLPRPCTAYFRRARSQRFCFKQLGVWYRQFTYNYLTRDTFGFAVKATWGQVNGVGRELFKDPITDSGVKNLRKVYYASKKVKMALLCLMSKQPNKNKVEH